MSADDSAPLLRRLATMAREALPVRSITRDLPSRAGLRACADRLAAIEETFLDDAQMSG